MLTAANIRRALALAVAAILGAAAAVAVSVPTVGEAAANTVYTATVAGTDMHSLDPHIVPRFAGLNGGAVFAASDGAVPDRPWYLEATFDLPVGAKITSVSVTTRPCYATSDPYVFGSYHPASGTSVINAEFRSANGDPTFCKARETLHKTGNPITTVAAGTRYAIDWLVVQVRAWQTFTFAGDSQLFYGATVRYTCTAPCVP